MARRRYQQNRAVMALASMPDYLGRLGRFFAFTMLSAIACLLLALVIGIVANPAGEPSAEWVQLGLSWLFDFVPGPYGPADSPHDASGPHGTAVRLLGYVLTCLYAGFSVFILSSPISIIGFSRHAVVDFVGGKLRVAYWVRLPEWKYLTHATAEVFFMRPEESAKGTMETKFLFRWDVPREDDEFPQDEYASIRGVRYFDIPLNAESDYKGSITLLDAIDEFLAPGSDVVFSVVVQGVGVSGQAVQAVTRYAPSSVLCGYDYVSIRRDDVEGAYRAAQLRAHGKLPAARRGRSRRAVLYYEHFNCVTRMGEVPRMIEVLQAADAWSSDGRRYRYKAKVPVPAHVRAHDARPLPLFELRYGERAERWFRVKEFAVVVAEWLSARVLKRGRFYDIGSSDPVSVRER